MATEGICLFPNLEVEFLDNRNGWALGATDNDVLFPDEPDAEIVGCQVTNAVSYRKTHFSVLENHLQNGVP